MGVVLKYEGGGAFFDGVPARDLTSDDVNERGLDVEWLAASDLYRPVGDVEAVKKACEQERGVIDLSDGVDDGEASLAGRALRDRRQED